MSQCQEPAWKSFLKFYNSSCPIPGRRGKIKLNFYFHFSLCCLKRFYEGLKGFMKALKAFIKPLGGTQRSGKKVNIIFISTQLSEMHRMGRVIVAQHIFNVWVLMSLWPYALFELRFWIIFPNYLMER